MMEKVNVKKKIGFTIIILTIILLNIFIGSNIKQPIWIIQTVLCIFMTVYLIISKIDKKRDIIIKGKIDIAVFAFMIATTVPLLLKTYVSLEGTINFILKYWSVYGMYILVRNIVTDEKKEKIIIDIFIISSIIPIIFGIDKLTFNLLAPLLELIDAVKIDDVRMTSTFGYANTLAAYLSLTTCLAISELANSEKIRNKIAYIIYIIIASITIILTQSKFVIALILFIIMLFVIKGIKDKKISKKCILTGGLIIVAFFIYFFIAINISKPLKIKENEKNCVIRGIESNAQYEFALDIDAKTEKDYDIFQINIVEITKYFSEKTIGKITFSNFNGTKTINVTTNSEIDHIEIRIKNQLNQELTIKGLKINNKPYILEYKIIPEEVVRVFTTFNFKNPSVWQRTDYWKDGTKIIKETGIIGAGGNTWRVLYGQVQDYLYYAKEAHSYILELLMSFGILGLMSYIFIIAITLKNSIELIKNTKQNHKKNKNMLAIIIGISIITIHCLIDFDMSYLIIEMAFYIFIAILNQEDKKMCNYRKNLDTIVLLIFIIISIGNILGLIAQAAEDETGITSNKIAPWISRYQYNKIVYIENNKIKDKNKIKYLKEYIKNEPYQHQNVIYEIMCNQIAKDPKIEDTEYILNTWKKIKKERTYELEPLQKRAEIMLKFSQDLLDKENEETTNLAKEVLKQLISEYEQYNEIILDYRRNGEIESITKYKHEYYTNIYKEAINLLEK